MFSLMSCSWVYLICIEKAWYWQGRATVRQICQHMPPQSKFYATSSVLDLINAKVSWCARGHMSVCWRRYLCAGGFSLMKCLVCVQAWEGRWLHNECVWHGQQHYGWWLAVAWHSGTLFTRFVVGFNADLTLAMHACACLVGIGLKLTYFL